MSRLREVPELLECPTCGLPVQAGDGPDDLAHHDCEWVLSLKGDEGRVEVDVGVEQLMHEVVSRAPGMSAAELSKVLMSVAALVRARDGGGVGGKASPGLLGFLRNEG